MNDEKKIYEALNAHHQYVIDKGFRPLMTVLVGSQNYGLATENSDYDTYSFVLPTLEDIATLKDPVSKTIEFRDGHINIKDIRIGLNLLKKTNPNSVEWFETPYKVFEPGSEWLGSFPSFAFRCNTKNMMDAIGGMAYQLTKRNMSPGKRLAHILRMHCMVYNYMTSTASLLSITEEERNLAMQAKLDPDNPKWIPMCEGWAQIVQSDVLSVDLKYFNEQSEQGKNFITEIQKLVTALVIKQEKK